MKKLRLVLITLAILLCFTVWIYAQNSCPAIVSRALDAIDANCDGLQRNSACYGYNLVQASFTEGVAEDFFTQPADRSPLADLATIKTAPLDEADDRWGVAVMSVQANIPNALPGQAVTFVLLGDTEVENSTLPQDAFVPADPIDVVVTENTRARSGAGFNFNVVAVIDANATIPADAISTDGEWVRVVYNDVPVWVNRSLVATNEALSNLPTFDGSQRTPMQAFYLRTGVGVTTCEEAQNVLMVQGPENIKVDLTVNGADISLGSTVLFETPREDVMRITVIDGEVIIYGAGENGEDIILPTGFTSEVCLSSPDDLGVDGESNDRLVSCAFSDPEQVPFDELGEQWCNLEGITPDILNYPVDLLCDGESEAEYLQNVLPSPSPDPTTNTQPTTQNDSLCSGLSLVSPLGQMPFGVTTFQWTAGAGIDQYIVSFYGIDGSNVASYFVDGDQTQTVIDTLSIPQGDRVEWEVLGLLDGDLRCSTPRSGILQRESNPNPPPQVVTSDFFGTWSCNGTSLNVPFSYSGADPGDTVTLIWEVNATPPFSGGTDVYSGASNSDVLDCAPCTLSTITGSLSASPSGKTYSMPTITGCGNF